MKTHFTDCGGSAARADGAKAGAEGSGMSSRAIAEYFDRLAAGWDDDMVISEEKISFILDAAGVRQGSRVLDVACGTGVLFPFYASRGVSLVTGVDISPKMAEIAGRKTDDPRFCVICGDIESLPVTEKYDCCVIYNAFPHFPQPERLICGLASRLSPGGSLTVAHGMSLEALRRHHSGSAAGVSREMLSAVEMSELMSRWLRVDTVVSDDEKFVISGFLPSRKGGGL